jgi:polyisoprenoid-binding protein YceI
MRGAIGVLAILLAVATTATAGRSVYVVNPEESRVRVHLGRAGLLGFLGHDHEIEAPLTEGRVEVDPDNPAASQVDLRWSSAALAIVPGTEPAEDIPKVEERMRGPEVLDVQEYPGIRFWSFDIRVEESNPEAGRWRLRVEGGLELKGSRHTVEVPMEVRREDDTLVTTGEVELRLSRLGISPPTVAGVVKVSDEFRISFEVHARRNAE